MIKLALVASTPTTLRSFFHALPPILSSKPLCLTPPFPHSRTSRQHHGVCQGGGHLCDLALDQAGTFGNWVGREEDNDRGGGKT